MASDLVDLEQLAKQCGVASDEGKALLGQFAEQVVAAFERAVGRPATPFRKGQAARQEIRDGTGTEHLWLDYPVQALTQVITLGYDSNAWDDSLTPTDITTVTFQVGSHRVSRVDGGTFGALGRPNYVRVTYDSQDDLPEDVKLAVARVTAALWRESMEPEGVADRELESTATLPLVADRDPLWQLAVAAHLVPRV